MSMRKVANQDEAVGLLGEGEASGLGRAAWARRHGVDPRSHNGRSRGLAPTPSI
jgi:hypothetical protein